MSLLLNSKTTREILMQMSRATPSTCDLPSASATPLQCVSGCARESAQQWTIVTASLNATVSLSACDYSNPFQYATPTACPSATMTVCEYATRTLCQCATATPYLS